MANDKKQRHVLGYDVGGTKVVAVLATADAEVLQESRLEGWASGDPHTDLARMRELGNELLEQTDRRAQDLIGIGLSVPGPMNPRTGVVIDAPNLDGWVDVPVGDYMSEAFGAPARVENDANAAALAEWSYGAGRGEPDLIYLTVSTGLGAGMVLDGRLRQGHSGQAGEIGHMQIVPDGRPCHCGLQGCLETYVGGRAMANRIRAELQAGRRSAILDLAGGDAEAISAVHWVEGIRAGDAFALELQHEFIERLAQGIGIAIHAFDPSCVALGTIVQRNPGLFLDPLVRRTRELIWPSLHHVKIVAAELGDSLPRYAALSVALPEDA